MQRAILPLLGATLCLWACEPEATTTPDEATTESTDNTDAAEDENAAAAAAEAEAKAKAEEEAAAKAAKLAERFAKLEEKKAKDAERWTDAMKADAKKLVAKKHRNAKAAVKAIVKGSHRHPDNVARDQYRHRPRPWPSSASSRT